MKNTFIENLIKSNGVINTKYIDTTLQSLDNKLSATQKLIIKTFGSLKEEILLKKDLNKIPLYNEMLDKMNDIVKNKKMGQYMNALYIQMMLWLKDNWKRIDKPKEVLDVAKELSLVNKDSSNAQFLSFASLFLHFWNPELYIIYDGTVIKALKSVSNALKGSINHFEVKISSDKNEAYKDLILALEAFNEVLDNKYSLNDLNNFLYWTNKVKK